MRNLPLLSTAVLATFAALVSSSALADPCGMVPPVFVGDELPITRVGVQLTYVFHHRGTEAIVLRPGFSGKVDEFGMLIPFPSIPEIRKVPENVFEQIAAAIDPPEVVVDLRPLPPGFGGFGGGFGGGGLGGGGGLMFGLDKDEVRVVREEAVGMYEVAVLEAGSAAALRRWMEDHGYVYPKGMDTVCDEYVAIGWCFVAVKTKVSQKAASDPRPGQREVKNDLPDGAAFDGHVQAMGFRFRSRDLVVPMRLSAYNPGELRNVVYVLAEEPLRIRSIPREYVRRQVPGETIRKNLTELLPIRVIGGRASDVPGATLRNLKAQRDPHPHNGVAADLFASDLIAAGTRQLISEHEQAEKELLRISERLNLRGTEIDAQIADTKGREHLRRVKGALQGLDRMTMTVIDGDFPREVIADQNLTFAEYRMPHVQNNSRFYDAKEMSAPGPKQGILILGQLDGVSFDDEQIAAGQGSAAGEYDSCWTWVIVAASAIGLLFLGGCVRRRRIRH